jgi:hypothetical protein
MKNEKDKPSVPESGRITPRSSTLFNIQLQLFISRRYLLSRKLPGAVNVITWVAMVGISLATVALVCVLSVLNGFNN